LHPEHILLLPPRISKYRFPLLFLSCPEVWVNAYNKKPALKPVQIMYKIMVGQSGKAAHWHSRLPDSRNIL
jgi:hypothetical protein